MRTEPPLERENTVRNSTIILLGCMGVRLWRRNVAGVKVADRYFKCAEPGQSDLWGRDWPVNLPWGRPWEIEVKRPGERPTEAQLCWLKESTLDGAVAFWGDNVDTITRVAAAVLAGGRIVWREGCDFDVETP